MSETFNQIITSPARYFINFSGGIDSTYYLWRFFKNTQTDPIIIHHCLYGSKRMQEEKLATDNILKYFLGKNIFNFEYVESSWTRRGFSGKIMDIEPLYFMAGMILKYEKYSNIRYIFHPMCAEEVHSFGKDYLESHNKKWDGFNVKNDRHYKAFTYLSMASDRKYSISSPYCDISKQQMIEEMPKELVDLTWYCRVPINGRPCNSCFNCKRVNKAKGALSV